MPNLPYTGHVSYTPYNNTPVVDNGPYTFTVGVSPTPNAPISWDQAVPSTFSDLGAVAFAGMIYMNNPNKLYTLQWDYNIVITGTQRNDISSIPTTAVSITPFLPLSTTTINDKFAATNPGSIGNNTYNVNSTLSDVGGPPINFTINIYNSKGRQYTARNYTFILTVMVTVTVNCVGSNLNATICQNYCSALSTRNDCFNEVLHYCLPANTPPDKMPISNTGFCQQYIADYIQSNGPSAQIDAGLQTYCKKYKGFGDLFSSTSTTDINLCACEMQQEQYTKFSNQLFSEFPGFSSLGLNPYCLVPQCAASPYKRSGITKATCNLPQCLNIGVFNNNGTFVNSSVTINQNASGCANIKNTGTPLTIWVMNYNWPCHYFISCRCWLAGL